MWRCDDLFRHMSKAEFVTPVTFWVPSGWQLCDRNNVCAVPKYAHCVHSSYTFTVHTVHSSSLSPMKAAGIDVRKSFWLLTGTPCSSSCMSCTSCSSLSNTAGRCETPFDVDVDEEPPPEAPEAPEAPDVDDADEEGAAAADAGGCGPWDGGGGGGCCCWCCWCSCGAGTAAESGPPLAAC